MNDIVDGLLVNLKILGKIKDAEKIDISADKIKLQGNTFYTSLIRFIKGDSRGKTIQFINEVITNSIDVLMQFVNSTQMSPYNANSYQYNKNYTSLVNLSIELKNCITGLESLKKTYDDDVHTVSQIEVIVNKIKIHTDIADNFIKSVPPGAQIVESNNRKVTL